MRRGREDESGCVSRMSLLVGSRLSVYLSSFTFVYSYSHSPFCAIQSFPCSTLSPLCLRASSISTTKLIQTPSPPIKARRKQCVSGLASKVLNSPTSTPPSPSAPSTSPRAARDGTPTHLPSPIPPSSPMPPMPGVKKQTRVPKLHARKVSKCFRLYPLLSAGESN